MLLHEDDKAPIKHVHTQRDLWDTDNVGLSLNGHGCFKSPPNTHTPSLDPNSLPWRYKHKPSNAQQEGHHKPIDQNQKTNKNVLNELWLKLMWKGIEEVQELWGHGAWRWKGIESGDAEERQRSWNKKTVHLKFCCLISSSINYKWMQDSTWNSKNHKRLAARSTKFISHKSY